MAKYLHKSVDEVVYGMEIFYGEFMKQPNVSENLNRQFVRSLSYEISDAFIKSVDEVVYGMEIFYAEFMKHPNVSENLNRRFVRSLSYEISDAFIKSVDLTFVDDVNQVTESCIDSKSSVFSAKMNVNAQFQDLFFAIYMADVKSITLNINAKNPVAILSVIKALTAHPLPNELKMFFKYGVDAEVVNVLSNAVKASNSLKSICVNNGGIQEGYQFWSLGSAVISNTNIDQANYPGMGDYIVSILEQRNSNRLKKFLSNAMFDIKVSLSILDLSVTVAMPSENASVELENAKRDIPACGIIGNPIKSVAKQVFMDVTNMSDASCISM